jgi:hypothetical protein
MDRDSRFCGVMLSVVAIRPKVRVFKPGQSDGFSIRSAASFGGVEKLEIPCRKILRHVKII